MGKMGLAGTSLIAAIPGGILFYILLMAVLKGLEPMPMTLKVTAMLLLLISLVMALFPAYLLIWFRRDKVVLAKAGGTAALGNPNAEAFAEDLVGQEFVDEDHAEPSDVWADSGEIGEDTDMLSGEFPAIDEDLSEDVSAEVVDDDSFPAAEFEVNHDLHETLQTEEDFSQTLPDLGDHDAGADAFTALNAEETAEDSLPTLEFGMEEQTAEPVEEADLFGQTIQEFDTTSPDEEFSPAADLSQTLPDLDDHDTGADAFTTLNAEETAEDSLPTLEFETEEQTAEPIEDVDLFGQTMQEFDTAGADEEFLPAADFDDEFTFEDFSDEENDQKK